MPNSVQELGMILGKSIKEQSQIKENLNPDEFDSQLGLFTAEQVVVELSSNIENKCYAENSFVIDHPVYGELDSTTLQIDGGYGNCPNQINAGEGRVSVQNF